MPDITSYTYKGVEFNIDDEVEVFREGMGGQLPVGSIGIISAIRDDDMQAYPIVHIIPKDKFYGRWSYIRDIRMIKPKAPVISVARPEELKAIESYNDLIYDESFYDYTDEEFEGVLRVYADMMKRSDNAVVKGLMMQWVKACPKNKLKDFYRYLLEKPMSAEHKEQIQTLDAKFA